MNLLDLPTEILAQIPLHLHDIQDFTYASSSCRSLYAAFAKTSPTTILRLAAASSCELFRPHPYFLIAATVRRVSEWARLRPANTMMLQETFENGIDALFELCVSKSGLTMDEIRRFYAYRHAIFDPVADEMDRCSEPQCGTQKLWYGSSSDAEPASCEILKPLLQYVIYGELFSSAFREIIQPVGPRSSPPVFDLDTRLTFIKYCIPDQVCLRGYGDFRVKYKGPYAKGRRSFDEPTQPENEQRALSHFLNCSKWNQEWLRIQKATEPESMNLTAGDWQDDLWSSIVQIQGLEGLEMLASGDIDKWKEQLLRMAEKVANLDEKFRPKVYTFGSDALAATDAPNMLDEVLICLGKATR